MTFLDIAWAAFLYRGLGSDEDYMILIANGRFFPRLRTNLPTILPREFNQNVKLFLNQWRCRVSKEVGRRLLRCLQTNHQLIVSLRDRNLMTLTAEEIKMCGALYGSLITIKRVKTAIAAKTLHVLNPSVFVPTDNPILEKLKEKTNGIINKSQNGYVEFIKRAQQNAIEITEDFRQRGLLGSPENYLSDMLKYVSRKTLAKYIDEYYWVTLTNGFPIPPNWNPNEI